MPEPKFKVGDFVTLVGQKRLLAMTPQTDSIRSLARELKSIKGDHELTLLHVVETCIQTCPGGTQFHYVCREHRFGPKCDLQLISEYLRVNEIELEPAPEPVAV